MLSDEEARELHSLQRRVFRHGEALDAAELRRLDELNRRAQNVRAGLLLPEGSAPADTATRADDPRESRDGLQDSATAGARPVMEESPSGRKGRVVVASLAAFACVAALAGAFVMGRATAPAPPAAMAGILELGEGVAQDQGWETWNYAGTMNGVDFFAGSPGSGEHCVLPAVTTPAPRPEAQCVSADSAEIALQTNVHTTDGGGRVAVTTSAVWAGDRARLQTSIDASDMGALVLGPGAGTVQQLGDDRQRVVQATGCDAPPALLDFSLTPGADVFNAESNAVGTSYWACTARGARAAVAVMRGYTVTYWLDDQDNPETGIRAASADFDPEGVMVEVATGEALPRWHWRVEWPVDGEPTLTPVLEP